MEYLVALILGVVVASFAKLSGFDRDRAFYPTALIVIASYYVLFATMGAASNWTLGIEIAVGLVFSVLALLGFKKSLWLKIESSVIDFKDGCSNVCSITVTLAESAPSDAASAASWAVSAVSKPPRTIRVPVSATINGFFVTLTFNESALGGARDLTWSVAYVGERGPVAVPVFALPAVNVPKTRSEADVYVSGSFLAGQGSKPLYILDAKVNVLRPLPRRTTRVGLSGEVLTNTGTELPVNRTEFDPDSIRTAFAIEGNKAKNLWLFNGFLWTIKPVGGEFTRKHPISNFTSDGAIRLSLRPNQAGKAWYTLYPSLGYEAGRNLNQPSRLFKQPVDLSEYKGIARIVGGVEGALGIYVKNKDPKVLLSGSYLVRTPLTAEPYTSLEYVPTTAGGTERLKVVRMRKNARPFTRNALTWNLSDSWAIAIEHRYGSLPPLFELIRHQVSLGIAYKRKF